MSKELIGVLLIALGGVSLFLLPLLWGVVMIFVGVAILALG